jgi:hypothetical protein
MGRRVLAPGRETEAREAGVKVIRTKGGNEIVMDDENHSITITDSNHNTITLNKNGIKIAREGGTIEVGQQLDQAE